MGIDDATLGRLAIRRQQTAARIREIEDSVRVKAGEISNLGAALQSGLDRFQVLDSGSLYWDRGTPFCPETVQLLAEELQELGEVQKEHDYLARQLADERF